MLGKLNKKYLIFSLAILIPLIPVLKDVLSGFIPFWYDIARDLLLAQGNLHKLTLIGPPSGIPGIFYGPYWIWALSFALLISKDPRIVDLIVGVIPYFIIAPLIFLRFSRLFGFYRSLILWLLFSLSFAPFYAIRMWNPHPAPIIFLALSYLLVFNDFGKRKPKNIFISFVSGFLLTLIINFHISFGIGLAVGIGLLFLLDILQTIKNKNETINKLISILIFSFGFALCFAPFVLFELRHGFHQTQTLLNTFGKFGAVVGIPGLTKQDIIINLFITLGKLLHLPWQTSTLVAAFSLSLIIANFKKLADSEKKLLLFLIAVISGILFIYLSARNPVWDYHFIGVEIIFVLLLGLAMKRSKIFTQVLGLWTLIVFAIVFIPFIKNLSHKQDSMSALSTEQKIVKKVSSDAKSRDYTVFAYSPSIYSYEYSYLFWWMENKDFSYDPGQIPTGGKLVYLIIPTDKKVVREDFVNFKTPQSKYQTTGSWNFADNILLLKRELAE